MPDLTTAVSEARRALREAEIAEQIERYAKERAEFGVCPKERDHFDRPSFIAGMAIGICLGIMLIGLISAVIHASA